MITCDEIIEGKTKTTTANFIDKNTLCETSNFYISLAFLTITYKTKQKHLIPFHVTNNELKKLYIINVNQK